jgi:hypothetical protein
MSDHAHIKKLKRKALLAQQRRGQQTQQMIDDQGRSRDLDREREEELREAALESARSAERTSSGAKTVWSAKLQMIRDKNTGKQRMATERWNRFAGTEGGGGRGL